MKMFLLISIILLGSFFIYAHVRQKQSEIDSAKTTDLIHNSIQIQKQDDMESVVQDSLLSAIGSSNENAVIKWINAGADVNAMGDGQYGVDYPLLYALECKKLSISKLLLRKGAQIDSLSDDFGTSPLHYAASFGDKELLNMMIQKGADPYCKDSEGLDPLDWAIMGDNVEGAQLLIELGVWKNFYVAVPVEDSEGSGHIETEGELRVPFQYVVSDKMMDLLQNFTDDYYRKLQVDNPDFYYPTIKDYVDEEGNTPLHNILDPKSVNVLVKAGLNLETTNNSEQTPLNYIMSLFCDIDGPGILSLNNPQKTSIAKAFIDAGANVNTEDMNGKSPLKNAIEQDNIESVIILIKAGAAMHDRMGQTPLHWILSSVDLKSLINTLVDAGCNVNAKDEIGQTPYMLAQKRGDKLLADLLKNVYHADTCVTHGYYSINDPDGTTNVRSAPNRKSDLLRTLPNGKKVEVTGRNVHGWCHIILDSISQEEGYVHLSRLKINRK